MDLPPRLSFADPQPKKMKSKMKLKIQQAQQ